MENGLQRIDRVIDMIESDICADTDCLELSRVMGLSVYEFRRIFSFVVGVPISDYVRNRRLTVAAGELMLGAVSITEAAEKYGYSNVAAFTKAFKSFHGVPPTAVIRGESPARLFSRPQLAFKVDHSSDVPFSIIEDGAFEVSGYMAESDITDTVCCENVWEGFYSSGTDARIKNECGGKIYACYFNRAPDGKVDCLIGARAKAMDPATAKTVPKSRWACFKLNTTDDGEVNGFYEKILYEYLPSAKLKRSSELPTLEVYPYNMETDGFAWEIRIPIE